MQQSTPLNKYLQPMGAPVDNSNQQEKFVPWQWGITQGIQTKKIRTSTMYFKKASALGASGTLLGTMSGGTFTTGASIYFDNVNNRIIINDGTTNRIVIGSV